MKEIKWRVKPVKIPVAAAGGVRKGVFAIMARNDKDDSVGFPQHVYKSDKRKTLLNYFGIEFR